jgi:hypothetical protein
VGHRARLGDLEKTQISCPRKDLNPPNGQPVASRCNDCANPVPACYKTADISPPQRIAPLTYLLTYSMEQSPS